MAAAANGHAASGAQYKKNWSRPSCLECRKSKRRCDSLLPNCSRCQGLGLACEYRMAPEAKISDVDSSSAVSSSPAEKQSFSDQEHDASVMWISSTLLFDSCSVRCLLMKGMRAIDWPDWLQSRSDAQLEQTIFKVHDPELPVISLIQMIVLIKGISSSFPSPKLSIEPCVRVCHSLLQSIEGHMRSLPSRLSSRMSSKNRSFETAACLVPWMTVLLTESGVLGDALSSLHSRLLPLSSAVVCFFFSKPPDAKVAPPTSSTKRSRGNCIPADVGDVSSSKDHDSPSCFTKNPFTALTNALSSPWDILSRMANAVVSQASDLMCTSDQFRLAVCNFTAPPAEEGLLHLNASSSSPTHTDLDDVCLKISASAHIDDASKCWYQIFVDCAKYLLCFRDSQHDRAQAHIADVTKSISLLKASNLSSVPTQIVPCFKSVVACCLSRISELGEGFAPISLARPLKIGSGVAAEDHAKQLLPILLGHVVRIISSVTSIVAMNATQGALICSDTAASRSCSLWQLKPISFMSESPPQHAVFSSGNQSDDGTKSPVHLLCHARSTSPQLRFNSASTDSHGGDWELLSSGHADDALDVNEYLTEDIFDCTSMAGVAAAEGGSLLSSWWDAAAAVVSSTVASAAAQPIVECNVLNFLED